MWISVPWRMALHGAMQEEGHVCIHQVIGQPREYLACSVGAGGGHCQHCGLRWGLGAEESVLHSHVHMGSAITAAVIMGDRAAACCLAHTVRPCIAR